MSVALVAGPVAAVTDPAAKIGPELKGPGTHRALVTLSTPAGVDAAAQAAEATSAGTDVLKAPELVRARSDFFVQHGTYEELLKTAARTDVESIRLDRAHPPGLVRSIPLIGADRARSAGYSGEGTAVVVLDTGIDTDHPAFSGRIVDAACFSAVSAEYSATSLCPNGAPFQLGPGAADVEIDACTKEVSSSTAWAGTLCYHGTHVAGIAAGSPFMSTRVDASGKPVAMVGAGVAPEAKIIPVQVFSKLTDPAICGGVKNTPCALAFDSAIMTGMLYTELLAGKHNIASVNLSLGGGGYTTDCDTGDGAEFKAVTDRLLAKGVATVVASGNEGLAAAVSWPACVSTTVAVGSTDVAHSGAGTNTDDVSDFSNRGKQLDLFAPGWPIFSAIPDDSDAGIGGTSMAAPHVAGAFAVMKQKTGGSVGAILSLLKQAGKPITYQSGETSVTTPRLDLAPFFPAPTQTPTATPTPSDKGAQHEPVHPPVVIDSGTSYEGIASPQDGGATEPACKRGKGKNSLTAAEWAKWLKTGKAATVACYLSIADKSSKIFSEVADARTAAKAYRVLKGKNALDRELLAAWLNYAHGVYNLSAKVSGKTTFVKAVGVGEKHRKSGTAAQVKKAAAYLAKHVNK
ncbi:S8 family peptidase [Nonomuraea sp. NPDC050663]|uniref:S8 family peptidase n=1 Tax=Nonomuraea sp. NPDC050663 TaxID=3364370 RepID=UPI0037B16F65